MADYKKPNEIVVETPSGPKPYSLEDVAKMPIGKVKRFANYIVGGVRKYYRDMFIISAGTAFAQNQRIELFRNGESEQGRVWNTQAPYVKDFNHTNMFEGGHFEWGVSCIVLAFELLYIALPAKAAAVGAGDNIGRITDAADHGVQPAGYNPLQYTRALMMQSSYRFRRGSNTTEESGLLIEIPSKVGLSASFGGQATGALVENSLGAAVELSRPKVLHSTEPFFMEMIHHSTLANPVDSYGVMYMDCIELRDTLSV